MGITKKISWENIFIFLFFVAFPFGQIIRLSFGFSGLTIPLQPLDIVVALGAVYAIVKKLKRPPIFDFLVKFLLVATFSFVVSVYLFNGGVLNYGFFYLLRLCVYIYFFVYVWNFAKKKLTNKKLLLDSLLGVSVASAAFGWVQFFMIPDIKAFFVYGWDMHLFRVVGTFLDPTFLGLIIVFGLLISIIGFIENRNSKLLLVAAFLIISLAFTYSRASYLAFIAGALVIGYLEKKLKYILYLVAGLVVLVFLLPTSGNHSIEFLRQFSAIARVDNYRETLQIIKKFPVLGVGFDNLCFARNKFIGIESFASHACSGSDSSLLFILATTGIVGFIIFVNLFVKIVVNLNKSSEAKVLIASSSALFIHSLFSNSIFYPWIMGWMIILLSISLTA